MTENPRRRIESLRHEIEEHNYRYYVEDRSVVTDREFDRMLEELVALEKEHPEYFDPNSPSQRVGGQVTKAFEVVVHKTPMLSLGNTYSREEVEDFIRRVHSGLEREDVPFTCELKYDGVAIGITYSEGKLVRAVTRGDGTRGDDISTNVRTIRSVPLTLRGNDYPDEFEIRGEIFMPTPAFQKMNREREEMGLEPFANPRNSASGTLKMQNSAVVAERNLDTYLYYVFTGDRRFESHYESIEAARKWGFKTPPPEKNFIARVNNIDEIFAFIDYWSAAAADLPFDIDGVVIKADRYSDQEILGFTAKSPRWAIAYKFETEQVSTVLREVSYQVGRTGAITPVANLDPIPLGGTTVKRASLHNSDQIARLNLHEGDTVYVEKGGEIIPKIVGVNEELRPAQAKPVAFITNCPECDTKLIRREGEAQHFCPNDLGCPPQLKGRIEHFISRKAMDIDGLGAETVQLLYDKGLIKNHADLYKLTADDLLPLDRFAQKSVENMLTGIEASKQIPFERVLFALGIRYVGETVAKKLARGLKNIDAISSASRDELIAIDEIGARIAESVLEYFSDSRNRELIERLKRVGLQFEMEDQEGASDRLTGISFVISGVFERHSRDELKNLIEKNGGKVSGSVSGKTNFVLAGDGMGPSKRQKAEQHEVKIISEDEFEQLLTT